MSLCVVKIHRKWIRADCIPPRERLGGFSNCSAVMPQRFRLVNPPRNFRKERDRETCQDGDCGNVDLSNLKREDCGERRDDAPDQPQSYVAKCPDLTLPGGGVGVAPNSWQIKVGQRAGHPRTDPTERPFHGQDVSTRSELGVAR